MDDGLFYFVIAIIGFIISVAITRAVFSIPRILRHLKAQTLLLYYVAKKLGVDPERARKIYFDAEGTDYAPKAKKIEKIEQVK